MLSKTLTLLFILILISQKGIGQNKSIFVIIETDSVEIFIEGLNPEEAIFRHFYNLGYFDISIEEVLGNRAKINLGSIYVLGNLYVSEADSLIETIRTREETFNSSIIENYMEDYYNSLVDQGYRNAVVQLSQFKKDSLEKRIDLELTIQKNEKIYLDEIVFSGNKGNSSKYLKKISGFYAGMPANKQNLSLIRSKLLGSGIFTNLNLEVAVSEARIILLIQVQERNLNLFEGLLGYVPDANGNGQIVGDLEIGLWNVFTEGNAFDFMYQRLRPETSRLSLGMTQNWFGRLPINVSLSTDFYQNDTTYQTRSLTFRGGYQLTSQLELTGGVFSGVSVSNSVNSQSLEPEGRRRGTDLGFIFSSLDQLEVPTKGNLINLTYGIINKSISEDTSLVFRQQLLNAEFQSYFKIGSQSVLKSTFHGFYLVGKEFTENDLIRFGGANSFRGYSEEQFTASQLIWGELEYRFLTERNSFLFLFGASGYYERPKLYSEPDSSFKQSDVLYSGGFGLSYKTQIGRLTFTYALSSTESIGNGKVHFGLKSGF